MLPVANKTAFISFIVDLLSILLLSSLRQIQKNILVACTKLVIVSQSGLLNVSLAVSRSLMQGTASTIHVREVLNIICGSKFDTQMFFFHSFSIQQCHDISISMVHSKHNNDYFSIKRTTFFSTQLYQLYYDLLLSAMLYESPYVYYWLLSHSVQYCIISVSAFFLAVSSSRLPLC